MSKFPHLGHFLNAYMHQDWTMYGSSVEEVVKTYAAENPQSDVTGLASDIRKFIASEGDNLEATYYRSYPNSVLPTSWGMSVKAWLAHVADLATKCP